MSKKLLKTIEQLLIDLNGCGYCISDNELDKVLKVIHKLTDESTQLISDNSENCYRKYHNGGDTLNIIFHILSDELNKILSDPRRSEMVLIDVFKNINEDIEYKNSFNPINIKYVEFVYGDKVKLDTRTIGDKYAIKRFEGVKYNERGDKLPRLNKDDTFNNLKSLLNFYNYNIKIVEDDDNIKLYGDEFVVEYQYSTNIIRTDEYCETIILPEDIYLGEDTWLTILDYCGFWVFHPIYVEYLKSTGTKRIKRGTFERDLKRICDENKLDIDLLIQYWVGWRDRDQSKLKSWIQLEDRRLKLLVAYAVHCHDLSHMNYPSEYMASSIEMIEELCKMYSIPFVSEMYDRIDLVKPLFDKIYDEFKFPLTASDFKDTLSLFLYWILDL